MRSKVSSIRSVRSRLRLRHLLTGVAIATTLALGESRGGLVQPVTAEGGATPAGGHAQVIAQGVFELPEGSLVWTLDPIEVEAEPTELGAGGAPGFLIGSAGEVVVRDESGARASLAAGEAMAAPPAELTVQAAGSDAAGLIRLTLEDAGGAERKEARGAGEEFESPGGSRDVDLVADVLAEGETAEIGDGEAPTLVLVAEGSVSVVAEGETRELKAGEAALFHGDIEVSTTAEDGARVVAAVIGVEVDADKGAEAEAPERVTPAGQSSDDPSASPSPQPSASPLPSSSPTPLPAPDGDLDDDGLTDEVEEKVGSNPNTPDTDGDGLLDGEEVLVHGTNPLRTDTDLDSLNDHTEISFYLSDPLSADGDDDRVDDASELISYGSNPRDPDSDDDGLVDGDEVILGTALVLVDTDADGLSDGDEVGVYGSNPLDPDVDDDSVVDGAEVLTYGTNLFSSDTDGDGFGDGLEIAIDGTDPLDPGSHA